jgi:putative tryptophan/tyrosine transport system substrate-binding protein
MNRRALILGCGAAFALPGVVLAQRGLPKIGFLNLISRDADSRVPAFLEGMRELGYVEDKTVVIEWRSADGNVQRLTPLAEGLVRDNVDVIVAVQTQAIEAARRATRRIPIVFAATQDPVGSGFARTLARPGGNITGISSLSADMASKQVELVKLALPHCSRVAVLVNPTNSASAAVAQAIENAATKIDLRALRLTAASAEELEAAAAAAAAAKSDAMIVLGDSFFVQSRFVIARAAIRYRLPTIFVPREHVMAGGLMSYGPSIAGNYRRVAVFVDRILKGAKPGELPIEQPVQFDLIINLKTAALLGLALPQSLLVRANEVIR